MSHRRKVAATILTPEEVDALARWGRFYNRSLKAELALAARIHVRRHALVALQNGREEIAATGGDVDADAEAVARGLAELEAEAFTRPTAADLARAPGGLVAKA